MSHFSDVWVCSDCIYAHHYGRKLVDGEWWVEDQRCDREPMRLLDEFNVYDNTCSNHAVEDVYDADGDPDGTTECEFCALTGHENGIDDFSWRACQGCGSTLGGARYRFAIEQREEVT